MATGVLKTKVRNYCYLVGVTGTTDSSGNFKTNFDRDNIIPISCIGGDAISTPFYYPYGEGGKVGIHCLLRDGTIRKNAATSAELFYITR